MDVSGRVCGSDKHAERPAFCAVPAGCKRRKKNVANGETGGAKTLASPSALEGLLVGYGPPVEANEGASVMRSRTGRFETGAGTFGHEALGGISSPAGSCVWRLVGLHRSVREWAVRQGWGRGTGASGAGAACSSG